MIEYKGSFVNYIVKGDGEEVMLYLHGWGGSVDSFLHLNTSLNYKNIFVDFPPFGKSEEPKQAYTLFDYAEIVLNILQKEKVKKLNIICHSFGARVAILLISLYNQNVDKLIITSGAGIKPKNKVKKIFRKIKYKIMKKINKNFVPGSNDYKNLSPVMKKTFSNIINFDLSNLAKEINCKTLLIYGNKDKETPLYMAKKLNKLIKNSKLIIYKNCGHFAYLENNIEFLIDIKTFLKGET